MGFQQGLSGLNGASKGLDVVGNNVANAGTVGFKGAQGQFADVYAAALGSSGANQVGIGTQVNAIAQQFTQGNITVSNSPLDLAINGQGFFRMSQSGTITYTRNGQFHLDKDGYVINSAGLRLTGYAADSTGTILNATPVDMQVSTADISPSVTTKFKAVYNLDARSTVPSAQTRGSVTGTSGPITFPLTITAGTNDTLNITLDGVVGTATIAAGAYANSTALATAVQTAINAVPGFVSAGVSATVSANLNVLTITSNSSGNSSSVSVTGTAATRTSLGLTTVSTVAGADNFSITDPNSYTSSTSGTVYDSLGNPHTVTLYFVKTSTAGAWKVRANYDGTTINNVDLNGAGGGNPLSLQFNSSGQIIAPATMPITVSLANIPGGATTPLAFTLDFSGSTQFGSAFSVSTLSQNGFTSGQLTGVNISANGVMQGRYSNGQSKALGQVVLVTFANPNGLEPLGQNRWAETSNSGQAVIGAPGTGVRGALQAAAVEESNVDLTAELVNMILLQRVYQANAQTIKTQDAVLQTLVNLR